MKYLTTIVIAILFSTFAIAETLVVERTPTDSTFLGKAVGYAFFEGKSLYTFDLRTPSNCDTVNSVTLKVPFYRVGGYVCNAEDCSTYNKDVLFSDGTNNVIHTAIENTVNNVDISSFSKSRNTVIQVLKNTYNPVFSWFTYISRRVGYFGGLDYFTLYGGSMDFGKMGSPKVSISCEKEEISIYTPPPEPNPTYCSRWMRWRGRC